jgi:hypothetical protein
MVTHGIGLHFESEDRIHRLSVPSILITIPLNATDNKKAQPVKARLLLIMGK